MNDIIINPGEFSTIDVSNLTGLSYRQLAYWANIGVFVPSIKAPRGSGSRSLYSHDDVVVARLLSDIIGLVGPLRIETLAAVVSSARELFSWVVWPETVYVTLSEENSTVSVTAPNEAHIVIHPSSIIMKEQSDAQATEDH